jgi:hypothetical protein
MYKIGSYGRKHGCISVYDTILRQLLVVTKNKCFHWRRGMGTNENSMTVEELEE